MTSQNSYFNVNIFSVVATILSLILTLNMKAEPLSLFNASISNWESEFSANINKSGPIYNINDEFTVTNDNNITLAVTFEHRYFWMPNFKVQQTTFDIHFSTILNSDISFGGNDYASGHHLNSRINVKHTGYNLYYEILNNDITFDLGITLMKFGGNIQMQSTHLSSLVKLKEFVPSGYAKLRYDIPSTNIYMGTEGSVLSMGDNSVTDYVAHVGYKSESGWDLEVGYHHFTADWNDFSSSNGDLKIDSYYASIDYHF